MSKNQSSIEYRVSRTAMMAAIHRYLATKEDNPGFCGPDNLAKIFLPPKAKFFLSFSFFRHYVRNKLRRKVPGTYEYVFARTKYFDTLFKQALQENIPQIVILGAGFDSRAIRFKQSIRQTTIFELDAPHTQEDKKKRLRKAKVSTPRQLSFIAINFDKESINDALSQSGYDKKQKSLFIMEGLTYYVSEKAIKDTLYFIKNYSGNGSTVAFDYFYQSFIGGKSGYYGAKEIYESVLQLGEPFKFGIEKGEIESFLSENGFDCLSHYTPHDLEQKYLYDDKGEFFGNVYGFACHVHAIRL